MDHIDALYASIVGPHGGLVTVELGDLTGAVEAKLGEDLGTGLLWIGGHSKTFYYVFNE